MPKFVPLLPHKDEDNSHQEPPVLDRYIKNITFFGDSSIPEDSDTYLQVFATAKLLAENGFAIVNGGGPGVMKAATDGAQSVNGHTVAVYWEPKLASIFEGKNLTNVTDESETYSNYMQRTLGLIEEGQVYVVCQGGTGTISEFGMVWALAKLYFGKHKPVILFGNFWKQLIEDMQKGFLLDDNELGVLSYAETPDQVLGLIQTFELEVATRMRKTYRGDETPFVLAPKLDKDYRQHIQEARNLHQERVANAVTKRQLEEFRLLVKPPARVLEIGAGAGYDISFLSQYYSVTAVEKDEDLVALARFENPNADLVHMNILDFEIPNNTFKGVWARDVLHHLRDPQLSQLMGRIARGLVPEGILFMVVREGEGEGVEKDMHAGKQVEKYYNYFTSEKVEELARQGGLELVRLENVVRSHKWLSVIMRKP